MRGAVEESDFAVRHYWLTWAEPAEILKVADLFEEWVLASALRTAPSKDLVGGWHASPERLALALRRRRPRGRGRHSLEDCLRGLGDALHPQLRLAWILLLVEGYPQTAARELIRFLAAGRDREHRAACAFGLSLLGRPALSDLREAFRDASDSVRDFLCQALWHLGPEARGSEVWLESYDSEWSRAVLYRLEAFGWQILLQRRAWPLWIDSASLAALGQLAFSLERPEQSYALRALLGWGPGLDQVDSLLRALALSPDREVSEAASLAAVHLGLVGISPPSVDELMRKLHFAEWETPRSTSLPSLARQRELLKAFAYLDADEQLHCLQELARHGLPDEDSAAMIWEVLLFPHTTPWRMAALQAYMVVGQRPQRLSALLSDGNPRMREAAAEAMLQGCSPAHLLASLDRPEVQQALAKPPHLLRALMEWPADLFERLERRLCELGMEGLLRQISLDTVHWQGFDRFTPVQHQAAAALIHRHRRLPTELVEAVAEGITRSPAVLEYWQAYPPEHHYCRGLAQLLVHATPSQRPRLQNLLRKEGEAAALALVDLLASESATVADQAARQLVFWPQAATWAKPEWLNQCPHPRVVALLAYWLA